MKKQRILFQYPEAWETTILAHCNRNDINKTELLKSLLREKFPNLGEKKEYKEYSSINDMEV